MSELNSSENNSVLSENNSSDEISNPATDEGAFDDLRSLQPDFHKQASLASSSQHSDLSFSELHSLQPLASVAKNLHRNQHHTTATSFRGDSELSGLLTRKQPLILPQAPKCHTCNKSVYKAEEIRAANKTFHKLCFKCNKCSKLLETNNLTEHQGDLFCRNCYAKHFGPKGYGFGSGAGILSSEFPTSPPLASVHTVTPPANQHGISYIGPNSSLKSTFSTHSNFEKEEKVCVAAENSPRGDSGQVSRESNVPTVTSVVMSETPVLSSPDDMSSCSLRVLRQQQQHQQPAIKTGCTYQMSAFNQEKLRTVSLSSSASAFGGQNDKCARCLKSVYAAEKVVASGNSYHKLCFSCTACKKMLSSMSCCNNSDNEIFCKTCYGKHYGPKGIGFGIGAGTLQTN